MSRPMFDEMNASPTEVRAHYQSYARWLAEQRLLTAVSYRLGFIDAAQARCGPEPILPVAFCPRIFPPMSQAICCGTQ